MSSQLIQRGILFRPEYCQALDGLAESIGQSANSLLADILRRDEDITEYLESLRVKLQPHPTRRGIAPILDRKKIARLLKSGLSYAAVAEQMGCHKSTIGRIAKNT